MTNLLWLQGGACSGNTMSFLNAQQPSFVELVREFDINILWHPSLSPELGDAVKDILNGCCDGSIPLDIFVYEGTVINGPDGTGRWNRFAGKPMKDWVNDLADQARYLVAIGDCASWGGIPATAPNPTDSEGLQYLKKKRGGALGTAYISQGGLPVINIWLPWPQAERGISGWTSCSGRRPFSAPLPRPAAPEICTTLTRSQPPSLPSARAACTTIWAAAGR